MTPFSGPNQYEKWYERHEGIKKRPETFPNNLEPLSFGVPQVGV